ncbi:MAG TPA: poly-gamma-glutamate biosynthesis protein PgsC [Lachnoclostridium sp.]|nr:poly-gamma-glutamate biosynthesis protein PgsC [Lachnoclostridium sp.]
MNQTLIIGILLALLFTELTGLSPGGIIVPAYFVLHWGSPLRMAGTLLLAFCCLGIVRLLSHHMILYGRRKYSVYLLVGILLKALAAAAGFGTVISIGTLIPGILGREMERQKVVPTLLSLGIVVLLSRLALILIHML